MSKPKRIQMSNWSVSTLTDEQINYAALDAFLSLQVYQKLKEAGAYAPEAVESSVSSLARDLYGRGRQSFRRASPALFESHLTPHSLLQCLQSMPLPPTISIDIRSDPSPYRTFLCRYLTRYSLCFHTSYHSQQNEMRFFIGNTLVHTSQGARSEAGEAGGRELFLKIWQWERSNLFSSPADHCFPLLRYILGRDQTQTSLPAPLAALLHPETLVNSLACTPLPSLPPSFSFFSPQDPPVDSSLMKMTSVKVSPMGRGEEEGELWMDEELLKTSPSLLSSLDQSPSVSLPPTPTSTPVPPPPQTDDSVPSSSPHEGEVEEGGGGEVEGGEGEGGEEAVFDEDELPDDIRLGSGEGLRLEKERRDQQRLQERVEEQAEDDSQFGDELRSFLQSKKELGEDEDEESDLVEGEDEEEEDEDEGEEGDSEETRHLREVRDQLINILESLGAMEDREGGGERAGMGEGEEGEGMGEEGEEEMDQSWRDTKNRDGDRERERDRDGAKNRKYKDTLPSPSFSSPSYSSSSVSGGVRGLDSLSHLGEEQDLISR